MELRVLLVIAVICVIAYWGFTRRGSDTFSIAQARPVVSGVDGRRYRVHAGHSDPGGAADAMAILNGRAVDLLRALRARYIGPAGGPPAPLGIAHPARRRAVERLLARYNIDNLVENSPDDSEGDTSYSIGKGKVLALCLRRRGNTDALHHLSVLTFVAYHELAHLAVQETGHPPKFWAAFKFLLLEAEHAGIYYSPDYGANPVRYCGMTVDHNPRWDPSQVEL